MNQKRLLIAFKGTSGDLFFWAFIDTLFLSLAKGLSPQEISLVFSVSFWISLCLKLPAYWLMKRLSTYFSVFLSTIIFLISAVMITFFDTLPLLIVGQSLYLFAQDFYAASDILLKNVCDRTAVGKNYVQCKLAGSSIYAVITLVAAILFNRLIGIDTRLPMYICIAFRIFSCLLVLFLKDSDGVRLSSDVRYIPGDSRWYFSRATVCFLAAVIFYQTFFAMANTNLRLILQTNLSFIFSEDRVVALVSYCIIGTRISKLLGNFMTSLLKKEHTDYEKLVRGFSAALLFIPVLGFFGCRASGMWAVVFIGAGLLLLYFTFDSIDDIQTYLVTRKLNNDQIVAVFAIKSTVTKLVCALMSTLITILISRTSFQYVMAPLAGMAIIVLLTVFAGSFYFRKSHKDYRRLWGEQLDCTDSLFVSAAILMLHYGVAKSEKVSPDQISANVGDIREIGAHYRRFSFFRYLDYDYEALYQCYLTGNPIAIHACRSGQWNWYPVLYMDRDDAVVFDLRSESVFLKDFAEVREACIFTAK